MVMVKKLSIWASYLSKKGFDPANQLFTHDFAGQLARNTNLSVKAIVSLGAYGMLANQLKLHEEAVKYKSMWTATLVDTKADFEKFINPICKFAMESPTRVLLSNWHETTKGKPVGFQARSVVGGYSIKLPDAKLNNR